GIALVLTGIPLAAGLLPVTGVGRLPLPGIRRVLLTRRGLFLPGVRRLSTLTRVALTRIALARLGLSRVTLALSRIRRPAGMAGCPRVVGGLPRLTPARSARGCRSRAARGSRSRAVRVVGPPAACRPRGVFGQRRRRRFTLRRRGAGAGLVRFLGVLRIGHGRSLGRFGRTSLSSTTRRPSLSRTGRIERVTGRRRVRPGPVSPRTPAPAGRRPRGFASRPGGGEAARVRSLRAEQNLRRTRTRLPRRTAPAPAGS